MYKITLLLTVSVFLPLCILVSGCSEKKQEEQIETQAKVSIITPQEKMPLWNGKDFTGWKLFIPDESVDVNTVWSVKDGVIHCTGVPPGYMRTEHDYKDYKLTLEWRWVEDPGNSGVLLHMSGPDMVWPKSIEAQLMAENAGDIWLIGGTEIKEHIDKSERRIVKYEESSEKEPGQWNKYDIFCKGNTIELYVNGVLQNIGTEASVTNGKICLQSEGKPIQFRNLYLEPLQ